MDIAELQKLLKAADPAALLVPSRILRRVIKHDRKLGGLGLQVPHRKSYVIVREKLLEIVDRDELGAAHQALPPLLILIACPDPQRLAAAPDERKLLKYWRLLFHCRIHLAFQERQASGKLTEADVLRRVHQIGQAEFDEVRRVLRQERYLLPPHDSRTAYEEFAALYLELRYFAGHLLPAYFPSFDDFGRVDALLAEDVDAAALFTQTRLAGAPDPMMPASAAPEPAPSTEAEPPRRPVAEGVYQKLLERANRKAEVGNVARAAILRERAAQVCPPPMSAEVRAGAAAELEKLTLRLQAALELRPAETAAWRQALTPLLTPAAQGLWPVEARLLYDLQTVCADHERAIYAVDLVEWALSLGKRPIKRALPNQREVHMVQHLRKAEHRLAKVRLSGPDRQRLADLFQTAIHHSEQRLRERFRPRIAAALDKVGMSPQNFAERVARNKLIEELLDRITERGFLNIGDLRDAISRNQLKLPDLSSLREWLGRDRLLQIDREFSFALDGVYRRAEVYMRWLQRLSSAGFGTPVGRLLTRYLILPFVGAFVVLEGLQHLVHLVGGAAAHHIHLASTPAVAGVGIFFLGLLYVGPFRQGVSGVLSQFAGGLRRVFVDFPAAVLRWPPIRTVLQSQPVELFFRYLFAPLLCAALTAAGFVLAGSEPDDYLAGAAAIFLATFIIFNSRAGRDLEEAFIDGVIRHWYFIRSDLVPGLFRAVMDFFKWLIEVIERILYSVDEWLRFRSGEGRLALVLKAGLGAVWFYVTYLVRFCFNVLIEPQINPIKHFPVVTVSHKLILPLAVTSNFKAVPSPLANVFLAAAPLSIEQANAVAASIVWGIPGIFGFLVWELQGNWKLYQANRPPELQPVIIGHHGETMLRLMKPGFHSGTLPKLFARLRKAERRATRSDLWQAVHRLREALHHVEESVRHFVDRELVEVLRQSKGWGATPIQVGAIGLSSNRIRIELCCPELADEGLWIVVEEQSGWLMAGVTRLGWLSRLARGRVRALATALAGFYKMAGVDLVREQIETCFKPTPPPYDITEEGLVVWPNQFATEAVYDLKEDVLLPRITAGDPAARLPRLHAERVVYRNVPVLWAGWVEAWEQDQAGNGAPREVAAGVRLLPQTNG